MGNISYEGTPCNYSSCHHHDAYAQGLSAHTGIALPVLAETRIIKPTQFKATAKFAHHCVKNANKQTPMTASHIATSRNL